MSKSIMGNISSRLLEKGLMFQHDRKKRHKPGRVLMLLSPSFMLKHLEPQSSNAEVLLPIKPIGMVVVLVFTLLGKPFVETAVNLQCYNAFLFGVVFVEEVRCFPCITYTSWKHFCSWRKTISSSTYVKIFKKEREIFGQCQFRSLQTVEEGQPTVALLFSLCV